MENEFEIIVNGNKHFWANRLITVIEVGKLAYKENAWYKEMVKENPFRLNKILSSMSATYKNAHPDYGDEGIMNPMQAVRVQNGTIFNIYDTSNA